MLKSILTVACIAMLTLSFNCELFTGPHNGSGADTTSHAWTFEVDTLGDGASQLYDVAIVSTNPPLAYAVGKIYLKDSTGNWLEPEYNLAKWDGSRWELERVYFNTVCGQSAMTVYTTNAVFAFGAKDIWIAGAGQITRWNGQTQSLPICIESPLSFQVYALWGSSPSAMYAGGYAGNIAEYDGSTWHLLSNGTTLDIRDIWGSPDGSQILAVASNDEGSKLLSIHGTTVTTVSDSGLGNSLYGVWFVPNQKYYAVGAGIFWKNRLTDPVWNTYAPGVVTSYVSNGIRGNDTSDVFVTGDAFEIVHYNGRSWHNYRDAIPPSYGAVGRTAIKGNLMITVGLADQKAIAIVGRRN